MTGGDRDSDAPETEPTGRGEAVFADDAAALASELLPSFRRAAAEALSVLEQEYGVAGGPFPAHPCLAAWSLSVVRGRGDAAWLESRMGGQQRGRAPRGPGARAVAEEFVSEGPLHCAESLIRAARALGALGISLGSLRRHWGDASARVVMEEE